MYGARTFNLPDYEDQRRDLLGTVNEVFQLHNISYLPNQNLVQIMLYGDKSFTHDHNRDKFRHQR